MVCLGDIRVNTLYKGDNDNNNNNNNIPLCRPSVYTLTPYFFKIHFNIILLSTLISCNILLITNLIRTNVHNSHLVHACYMFLLSSLILYSEWWTAEIMKLLKQLQSQRRNSSGDQLAKFSLCEWPYSSCSNAPINSRHWNTFWSPY